MDASETNLTLRTRKRVAEQLYREFNEVPGEEKPKTNQDKKEKKQSPYNISNILWIIASAATFYYTDFAIAALNDTRVSSSWFNAGCTLIGINISICLFLIVYLSYYKKVDSDLWEVHYPYAIPIATAAFILGSLCLNVALWPLWRFLTPVILFVLFMGCVVVIAMLPAF